MYGNAVFLPLSERAEALIVRRLFSSLYYEDFDRTSLSFEIQTEVPAKNREY